jgi:hypothetical protein
MSPGTVIFCYAFTDLDIDGRGRRGRDQELRRQGVQGVKGDGKCYDP